MEKKETKKAAKAREILERAEAKKTMIEKRYAETFSTPIAQAVAPLKEDAVKHAEQEAKEYIARLTQKLEENGNDLNKVAPYPHNSFNMGREEYKTKLAKHDLYRSFTKARAGREYGIYRDNNSPELVDICPVRVEKFIETAKDLAAAQYEAFVFKLVKKVGQTVDAALEGNHVWGYSFLRVTLSTGEKQVWKTQQIVNYSKYHLAFPQWPTRQIKTA